MRYDTYIYIISRLKVKCFFFSMVQFKAYILKLDLTKNSTSDCTNYRTRLTEFFHSGTFSALVPALKITGGSLLVVHTAACHALRPVCRVCKTNSPYGMRRSLV